MTRLIVAAAMFILAPASLSIADDKAEATIARKKKIDVLGTITDYKDGCVSLSIGANAGLKQGTVLHVFRTDETGTQRLGIVVVERVLLKEAVGTFKPAGMKNFKMLQPDDRPKMGDRIERK